MWDENAETDFPIDEDQDPKIEVEHDKNQDPSILDVSTWTIPAPAPLPMPAPPSQQATSNPQAADQARIPFVASNDCVYYCPVTVGKWWYRSGAEIHALGPKLRCTASHIGRIMETTLGERKSYQDSCQSCRNHFQECWTFTWEGGQQIKNSGKSCVRCRATGRKCCFSAYQRRIHSPPYIPAPLPTAFPHSIQQFQLDGPFQPPPNGDHPLGYRPR